MNAFPPGCGAVAASVLLLALTACGGGTADGGGDPPPPVTVDHAAAGVAVVKVRSAGTALLIVEERLTSIFEQGPVRSVALLQPDGRSVRRYAAPEGWSLVDAVAHPSGDVSVVLTARRAVRIVRLGGDGVVKSDAPFTDPAVATDPYIDEGGVKDDEALQPHLMRDAARGAPLGESLVLVLRTGRNAVVAYRLDPLPFGGWQRAWRTLVEPGASIFGRFLTSGSHDVYGQLESHVRVHVDVDAAGTIGVAVPAGDYNAAFTAHQQHYGELIDATYGAMLTRLTPDGRRLGTTVINTVHRAETHGLRATPRGFALVGRVRSEVRADGTGWNAWAAFVRADGVSDAYRVIDVDRGDVLVDIAALPGGRYAAVGSSGYSQNPAGASISEAADPLLLVLNADGGVAQRLAWPAGLRHNQLRALAAFRGGWVVGGSQNGPGTHSGDGDPSRITADGYARTTPALPSD